MAKLRPFHGLRYAEADERLGDLTAPPYDVLSERERDSYAIRSDHNIVRLTLPEGLPDDRSKFVRYARSAQRLEQWRREEVLIADEKPNLYRYTQSFSLYGQEERYTRTSVVGLIEIEPYEGGSILPHEQTYPEHRQDRQRLLEATNAHLECIFGLYEDGGAAKLLAEADADPAGYAESDGVEHTFERIADPSAIKAITEALAPSKVWIADGHHRYETALAYRAQKPVGDGLRAEDFMPMALCAIDDPGLVLLPTHRVVKELPFDNDELRARLKTTFELQECPSSELIERISQVGSRGSERAIGIALQGRQGLVARVEDIHAVAEAEGLPGSPVLRSLDVTVLHELVFERMFGLTGTDFYTYTRDANEAISKVESGAAAAFLMNPPTADDMRRIATGGERMPQKSTYYYPKLLSGLVMWSLKDFSP